MLKTKKKKKGERRVSHRDTEITKKTKFKKIKQKIIVFTLCVLVPLCEEFKDLGIEGLTDTN